MTKEKKIGVSKVVIQMGDKEATLTVEQARELRDALNALLGEKVVERVIEKHGVLYPYQPYIYHSPYWSVTVGDQPQVYGTSVGTYNTGGTYTITATDGDTLPVS
jgi:hypothetical protein